MLLLDGKGFNTRKKPKTLKIQTDYFRGNRYEILMSLSQVCFVFVVNAPSKNSQQVCRPSNFICIAGSLNK